MDRYRIWLRSVPGPYEQYAGKVDVTADSPTSAQARALGELQRTSFPDRSPGMWRIERIEVLP